MAVTAPAGTDRADIVEQDGLQYTAINPANNEFRVEGVATRQVEVQDLIEGYDEPYCTITDYRFPEMDGFWFKSGNDWFKLGWAEHAIVTSYISELESFI